jgi:predicted nucleic acid-binding protein
MIFVDTSAWFARLVTDDPNHQAALEWSVSNRERLITTDYVIDETLTLLRVRGQHRSAIVFGEAMFEAPIATIHYVTPDEIREAWRVFRDYRDKAWSFTDATSKVVMERLGIRQAAAFDEHFRQFGTVEIVPSGNAGT